MTLMSCDRHFGDDKAIVGGVARLNDRPLWSLVRKRVERSDKVYRTWYAEARGLSQSIAPNGDGKAL